MATLPIIVFISLFAGQISCSSTDDQYADETPRIVGGSKAKEDQFPFAVALYYDEEYVCSGSVISDRNILTAAHCVVESGELLDYSKFEARVGNVNREKGKLLKLESIIANPEYSEGSPVADLAILKTTEVINATSICLAASPSILWLKRLVALGWGSTTGKDEANDPYLKYDTQRVISNLLCSTIYLGLKIPKTTLCAAGLFSGTCHGDSGGPLIREAFLHKGSPVQVGVTVFVHNIAGCATAPAGYTRVSYFREFIEKNTSGVCFSKPK